ncbi:MAG: hypothetical protein IPN75_19060 [Dechloromonas sp.]|uniref:Uncharacterized protein n=1 Tax=Candidatus Dechloromonas phosphorivorans TaxID=2899244 RepID=A0A9D7QPT6_9RHOO|nr:hypothetical protein [Candidatus Dechloromonas phosphorivorans]
MRRHQPSRNAPSIRSCGEPGKRTPEVSPRVYTTTGNKDVRTGQDDAD